MQTPADCAQLLHCALRWTDCESASSQQSRMREGPGDRTSDSPVLLALCEALYIALTFPEAPIQARAAQHPHRGNTVSSAAWLWRWTREKMSYQGKKNIPKITVSNESYLCFTGCGNFDAWLLRITAQSDSLPFYGAAAMDPKHSQHTLPPWL